MSDQLKKDCSYPDVECPKCGEWQQDFDGFGVQKCASCDYCRHPSISLKLDGMRCDLCGKQEPPQKILATHIDRLGLNEIERVLYRR